MHAGFAGDFDDLGLSRAGTPRTAGSDNEEQRQQCSQGRTARESGTTHGAP
jgi:hypothetical protein